MHFRRWKFALWFSLLLAACSFDPIFDDDYQRCSADEPCPGDCVCSSVGICLPPNGTAPNDCLSEDPGCVGVECKFGCRCVGGLCLLPGRDDQSYCNDSTIDTPFERDVDLWVTTTEEQDTRAAQSGNREVAEGDGLTLREALTLASVWEGPSRIGFSSELGPTATFQPDPQAGPWEVPDLCYLDGRGVDVILDGAETEAIGLFVNSAGVVISDLTLRGFTETAVRLYESVEVHLFRMRMEYNIGTGLLVDGSEDVWLGRGRELAFEEPRNPPRNDLSQYDMNVIRSNEGNGVDVSNSSGIYIYGSFIGYELDETVANQCVALGNGGVGLVLENVWEAVVGTKCMRDVEYEYILNALAYSVLPESNPYPDFVSVGCNAGGGVSIVGGGHIHMPGLSIGNTHLLNRPFGENASFGLDILDVEGPVSFGPSVNATDLETYAFGALFYEDCLPLNIENNGAEVVVVGAHFINLGHQSWPFPEYAIKLTDTQAPVRLYHLAITGSVAHAAILVENPGDDVSIVNNLFWRNDGMDTPILAGAVDSTRLSFHHNMQFGFSRWLPGDDGDLDASNFEVFDDPLYSCNPNDSHGVMPRDPVTCFHVDAGAGLGLDRSPFPGEHAGCAPDIGAFECVTEACRNVSCQ